MLLQGLFSINRMESNKKYQFKAIAALKLIDLKAAKKTVPFKKFCNLPLSYEEELKQNFQTTYFKNMENGENIQPERTLTKGRFRRSLNKLARPRHNTLPKPSNNSEIGRILKKCKKLMNNGLHCKTHMNRFQKYSDLCLNTIQKRMTNLISDGLSANYYYI